MARSASTCGDIAFAVIDGLALILTILRLSFRLHIRRFWWEDAWAALAFVCGTGFIITQYMSTEPGNPKAAVTAVSIFSKTLVFAVRMSILYSTIRIIPQCSSTRTVARIVGILFVLFYAASMILKAANCKFVHSAGGPQGPQPVKCTFGKLMSVFQVITDCISDAILVILALKLLWRVKLPRRQRRMILSLFASSAVVSILSLVHSVFQLSPRGVLHYALAYTLTYNFEMMLSLLVCNLLVVVTFLYRTIHRSRDGSDSSESEDSSEDDDDFTTRNSVRRTTEVLTTVDLDTAYSGVTSDVSFSSPSHSVTAEKNGSDTGYLN